MRHKKYAIEDVKKAVGGNYKSIHAIINEHHINTSYFNGQGWNVGLEFKPFKGIPNEKVFVENSTYRCSWRLREKLLKLKQPITAAKENYKQI